MQFADDSLDAVGIALREKIPEIIRGPDRPKLLRRRDRRNRTGFSYLREIRTENEGLVDLTIASWNPLIGWLRRVDCLRRAA